MFKEAYRMAKVLIFNFDGTNNEPSDAVQDVTHDGGIKDASITNVLKFHLLLGGTLKKEDHPVLANGSRTLYYHGVGTWGNFWERLINAGVAPESWDIATILNKALDDFKTYYEDEGGYEKVLLTGFSRGAAIARRFASLINDRVADKAIIEMVFDTVASIGLPNLSSSDRPKTDVVFENGCTLPGNVEKALHLVSLDDKRRAFQPTLMNQDGRITEIWFPGAHADVGGGYFRDGLSDSSLRFFLDWFEQQDFGIDLLTSQTISYENLLDKDAKYEIGVDDVQVDPDPLGKNHEQERNFLMEAITLTDRRCCVIQHDKIAKDELPVVHWSAAKRVSRDRSYRPHSLENLEHHIIYSDFSLSRKIFQGFSQHKLTRLQDVRIPDDTGITTFVHAHKFYNRTRILFEAGKTYSISVIGSARWNDGGIKSLDGEGWQREDIQDNPFEVEMDLLKPFRRVNTDDANWFSLCGSIGQDDTHAFVIGNGVDSYTAPVSGEFCAFANDLEEYYGNNTGFLEIRVSMVAG